MKEHSDSSVVVIADVDCTVHKDLCSQHGVRGYPTLKYYQGGEPEDYKGGRSLKDLQKFVKDNLMEPACDSNNKDACKAKVKSITADIKAAEKKHEDLLESLQKQ